MKQSKKEFEKIEGLELRLCLISQGYESFFDKMFYMSPFLESVVREMFKDSKEYLK